MKTKKNSNSVKDSDSGLLNRTAQQSESKMELLKIDLATRRYNRGLPTERVLRLLQSKAPRFWELAEVVGKWIWIRFEGKQAPQITGELAVQTNLSPFMFVDTNAGAGPGRFYRGVER
jgi:hypothetical protein